MFDFQQCTMFVKKKKPLISLPENFEHRLHIGFDEKDGTFVGLPLQWTSIVGADLILNNSTRALPVIDPSEITQTEILGLKTIVRGENGLKRVNSNRISETSQMARSNSLHCNRRQHRRQQCNVHSRVSDVPVMPHSAHCNTQLNYDNSWQIPNRSSCKLTLNVPSFNPNYIASSNHFRKMYAVKSNESCNHKFVEYQTPNIITACAPRPIQHSNGLENLTKIGIFRADSNYDPNE